MPRSLHPQWEAPSPPRTQLSSRRTHTKRQRMRKTHEQQNYTARVLSLTRLRPESSRARRGARLCVHGYLSRDPRKVCSRIEFLNRSRMTLICTAIILAPLHYASQTRLTMTPQTSLYAPASMDSAAQVELEVSDSGQAAWFGSGWGFGGRCDRERSHRYVALDRNLL